MAKKIHKFKNFRASQDGVELKLDLSSLADRLNRAQFALDSAVMTSMVPYMPMQDGTFINLVRAKSASVAGSGEVYAAVPPSGRFLYEGKNMVDVQTGSPWARKGAKKVLVSQYGGKTNARENLSFSSSTHPKARPHWFDAAKEADLKKWESVTQKQVGGK